MLGAKARSRIPNEPPTRPITIHGRRMPRRDEVRSLILPKNGLATKGKVTSRGGRKTGAHESQCVESDETPSVHQWRIALQRPLAVSP